eukprot:Gregarina_sp_Poly_1__5887@NODE_30_length_19457_cov_61_697267_g27_i0_p2_GENE_NODE_30_length_19457_cov_61_697267_g27_i0NODE_30_length_19457_cov_61_697267_g27_i0_p2_ORF_typecomplete_len981_score118_80zfRING_2/PF13639_6/1_3e06zfRING_2/PF13639_6/3e02FANCL_C/PF11793_8/0_00013FANCL_C/PF11793_8/8_8e02zfANAPC11/PF12861_7/0_0037zfANAPC11/PF12861_7/1_3e03zfC3HC4/PF00097_25/0_00076zfC3HC4/PF00097_25/6_3e03zfRING_UBOX/PF13445_6/0_015zfC3HC4_2/PF13923_6/0_0054zfC3HC4_2/PF13923_6/4_1e03zfRING_11/PF17123_5/0_01
MSNSDEVKKKGWISAISNPFAAASALNVYWLRKEQKRVQDIQTRSIVLWTLDCRLVLPPIARVYCDHGPFRAISQLQFSGNGWPHSLQTLPDASREALFVPCVVEFSSDHIAIRPKPSNAFQQQLCGEEPFLFSFDSMRTVDGDGWEFGPSDDHSGWGRSRVDTSLAADSLSPGEFGQPSTHSLGRNGIRTRAVSSLVAEWETGRPRSFTDPSRNWDTIPRQGDLTPTQHARALARTPVMLWRQNNQVLIYEVPKRRLPLCLKYLLSCFWNPRVCASTGFSDFERSSDSPLNRNAETSSAEATPSGTITKNSTSASWFPSFGTQWLRSLGPHSRPDLHHFCPAPPLSHRPPAEYEFSDTSPTQRCCLDADGNVLRRRYDKVYERARAGFKSGALILFDSVEQRALFHWLLFSVRLQTLGYLESVALHDLRRLAEIEAKMEALCHRGLVGLPFNENDTEKAEAFESESEADKFQVMQEEANAKAREEALLIWTNLMGHLRNLAALLVTLTKHPRTLASVHKPWRQRRGLQSVVWKLGLRNLLSLCQPCREGFVADSVPVSDLSQTVGLADIGGGEQLDHIIKFTCWLSFIPARYLPQSLLSSDTASVGSRSSRTPISGREAFWNTEASEDSATDALPGATRVERASNEVQRKVSGPEKEGGEVSNLHCILGASAVHAGHTFNTAQPDDEYWTRVAKAFWSERAGQVQDFMRDLYEHFRRQSPSPGAINSGSSEGRPRSLSSWASLPIALSSVPPGVRQWPAQALASAVGAAEVPAPASPTMAECAICLTAFVRATDIVSRFPTCLHFYHPKCLLEWAAHQQAKQVAPFSRFANDSNLGLSMSGVGSTSDANRSLDLVRARSPRTSDEQSPRFSPPEFPYSFFSMIGSSRHTPSRPRRIPSASQLSSVLQSRAVVNRLARHRRRWFGNNRLRTPSPATASVSAVNSPAPTNASADSPSESGVRYPLIVEIRCPLCRKAHLTQ